MIENLIAIYVNHNGGYPHTPSSFFVFPPGGPTLLSLPLGGPTSLSLPTTQAPVPPFGGTHVAKKNKNIKKLNVPGRDRLL